LQQADVAIEFTTPAAALSNIKACIEENVAVVVGTTGWHDQLEEAKKFCLEKNGSLVYASNFSIGVNLFFMLNSQFARLMKSHEDYKVHVEEMHHVQKKDAPSGTALTLANDLEKIIGNKKIEIQSTREGEVIGEHRIIYEGIDDIISIQHKAITRASFGKGAVAAAQWISRQKGFFNFCDIINEL
jgi:4-hydroxy-tetrahydrodipicolinate reductase